MSKTLSELLGASQPALQASIQDLERASGNQSVDVRLSAEIIGKVRHKIRALGLDQYDTNGPELYSALMGMVRLHDEFLARHINANSSDEVSVLLPKIVAIAQKIRMPRKIWAVKHSVARRLLSSHPPKRLMKLLGYRSMDSMLKRESMEEIYGVLRFAEGEVWFEKFVQTYHKLKPSDFEERSIDIIYLDDKKWRKVTDIYVKGQHNNIAHSKEMGSILVLPLPVSSLPGVTITVLSLLLHNINELRIYSSLFKLEQVKPEFGRLVAETVMHDSRNHAVIAGQDIHWRVIHHHFGSLPQEAFPEVFEPHLQAEDLEWRKAEDVLFHLEPALQFWQDMDYVGAIISGQKISFNLIDVATNFINQLPYNGQISNHMEQSLWSELFSRYLGHRAMESQVLRQLDNEFMEADLLSMETSWS